jgi:hypothetical protein
MSPGGQEGRLVVQRDRPCTLKPALRISHSRTRQRPYARRRRAASTCPRTRPLTQTGFDLLGHSSVSVTLDVYGRVLEDQRSEAADAIGAQLAPPLEVDRQGS